MIIDPRNYPPLMERYVKGQDLAQTPGAVILNEDCPYGLRFVRGHTFGNFSSCSNVSRSGPTTAPGS